MGERNFLFFNSCLEWQALSEGVEGCFAASEVVRAICETDFQEQGTILNNPKTDYYHKYVKTPHDGMFLMNVSRPAAQTNIHVFIDTRLSPNFIWIEKVEGQLEESLALRSELEYTLNKAAYKYGWGLTLQTSEMSEVHHVPLFISAWTYIGDSTNGTSQMNQSIQTQFNYFYGSVSQSKTEAGVRAYTDEQIAKALLACVGAGKVVDAKWKWAGVYWFLRWTCNYPVDSQKCCERIQALQLPIPEGYACSYENIRKICKLSFMEYDANKLDQVKVSKFDLGAFAVCREIVLKMTEELEKICLASA